MHVPMTPVADAALWHALSAKETVSRLQSDAERGLSHDSASSLLAKIGPNRLRETTRASRWSLFLGQFKNILVVILLIAALLSGVLGHGIEAGAIAVIVLFAVILGFLQEDRAERAIEALRRMVAPTATVIRDGEEEEIAATDLVPGDLVLLAAGDRVPADGRCTESVSLQADEASLTGESLPVSKTSDPLGNDVPLADRRNMLFAGTNVTYGRGRMIVTETGMQTEFGKIAGMLETVETGDTPLQKNLDRLGHTLGKVALGIVCVIALLGLSRGQPLLDMIIFGIALAVAVVPEALPAVVTISLAIGVQKMVKRHALIRRLSAVETLGATSVICSDKTGTLTKDEMTVRRILVAGTVFDVTGAGYEPQGTFVRDGHAVEPPEALRTFLEAATLCSDARLLHHPDDGWHVRGDPTEGALVVTGAKAGLKKAELDERHPRVGEIPFTSESKRMTTLHRYADEVRAYAKGAPEVILSSCTRLQTADGTRDLTDADRKEILDVAQTFAGGALRVLGVASKPGATEGDAERSMVFLGLAGMIDPPRAEAAQAVLTCRNAGIRVVMITGDHPATAKAIARELGILQGDAVVTGTELAAMDAAALEQHVETIDVYARVSPADKLRIVTALQKKGHVVAMTGDGVNDAPALKKADIGIAMGMTGTDVTKEASAMTLTDDNFASIVAAVEEGRGIFGNIKKYLMYLLSSNIGEMLLMTGSSVLGLPLPLTAVQILYVNLATDGLPALALAIDPPEQDLMRRHPRNPRASIFSRPVVALMLAGGLWSMLVNLVLFWWMLSSGHPLIEAMTMAFVSLVLIQFFKAYAFRSDRHSSFRQPFRNKWLNVSILWELFLLGWIIYLPFLQSAFDTFALTVEDWILVILASVSVLPVLEGVKWLVRRKAFGETRA